MWNPKFRVRVRDKNKKLIFENISIEELHKTDIFKKSDDDNYLLIRFVQENDIEPDEESEIMELDYV